MLYNVKPDLQFSTAVILDDYMYFYSANMKALFRWNVGTKYCEYLCELCVDGYVINNIDSMFIYKNVVYMLDVSGKYLIKYVGKNEIMYFEIGCDDSLYNNYVGHFVKGSMLIIVTRKSNKILIFDLDLEKKINSECVNQGEIVDVVSADEKIFLIKVSGEIVSYEDGSLVLVKKMGTPIMGYGCKNYDDSYMFIGCDKKIYSLSLKDDDKKMLCMYSVPEEYEARMLLKTQNGVIAFPKFGGDILVFADDKVQVFTDYPSDYGYVSVDAYLFWGYAEDSENYYISQQASNYTIVIDKKNGMFKFKKMLLKPEQHIALNYRRKEATFETENTSLDAFLEYIVQN